ncbi:flagellar hook-associated protein 3 FlgL [Desulfosarcina sp. BuS5]|uniref:flagellar hook-associated protein FlgL n=1 Tax=Desulfosarcina sp. BuS5 TaxID=933262 RepID=UPI0004819FC7|nr:flagellar hook-associated protein FlgL [Desulfosarcina sp. BuS5]WDN90005.1 flagellar hook-associated protein 3 FlgL [Desulfosarcina sp. BuS5]
MRVSSNAVYNTIIGNLSRNSERLLKAQVKVATEKRVNKPSDDPVGMGKVLDYRKRLASIDQYQGNIAKGKARIQMTETTLDMVSNLLTDAKNIAMDQSTGSVESSDRAIAAEQIASIREQVLQLANTRLGGEYIFAGHETSKPAFLGSGNYDGDLGEKKIIIDENTEVKINLTGEDIFPTTAGSNVFDVMKDLQDALEAPVYVQSTVAAQANLLADARDQVNLGRAGSASTFKRLEGCDGMLDSFKLRIEDMLSKTEDADLATAIVELQFEERAYEASLAASARVMQPSLLNFLK